MGDEPELPEESRTTQQGGPSMPPWVPRAILLFIAGLAALVVAWWVISRLRGLLVMLVVALFASFALEPAVNWLTSRGVRRGLAASLVLLGVAASSLAFLFLIGQALATQVSEFVDELPTYLGNLEDWVNDTFDAEVDFNELIDRIQERDDQLQELAANVAGNALDITFSAIGLLFQLFAIALFTYYMVADGPRFRRAVLQFLPPDRQQRVITGWEIAIEKTGGYIYSRALLAVLSAIFTTVVLAIIGVPFAIALGLFTGVVSQFIPTIGTYIGGALPVLIALSEDPVDALVVLAFIVIYQQIENYFFAPKITAHTMDLHPAVAFGTVIAGASTFGGVGALLALPAAAVIQAVGSTYVNRHDVIDTAMTREPVRGAGWRRRRSAGADPHSLSAGSEESAGPAGRASSTDSAGPAPS